jgi:hypothetical protein
LAFYGEGRKSCNRAFLKGFCVRFPLFSLELVRNH